MNEHGPSCHVHSEKSLKKPWFRNPLLVTSLLAFALLTLSFLIPGLHHFRMSFVEYIKMMWLPISIGFLAGGLIDYYVPREYISKYLARRGKRTIIYSTGLGFLASACSHGIIALSMELHKKGASGPAVVSFLLASPWANLPVTFLLVGFFGWKGLLIILSALFVSMTTGLIFLFLDEKGLIEKNKNTSSIPADFSIVADVKNRFNNYHFSMAQTAQDFRGVIKGMISLAEMVLWWILIGMILASLISTFVPASIFERFMGPSVLGLFVTLAVATVLEICSEGTAPLAFEIYKQTGALGNAFAFLMGGVVTDYTEVGLVWVNLGRRTAIWLLAVTIPQVFLIAWVFNLFF